MPEEIDTERLRQITDELIASLSSPPFVEAMRTMKETPLRQRLSYASNNLTPSVLAEKGVKFPEGMRITSRYFEPGSRGVIEVNEYGAQLRETPTIPEGTVTGAWACACGGGLTVCGGAGGGS